MKLEVGEQPDGAPNSLAGRIASMRDRIAETARRYDRSPGEITLVAVTKKQPRETVVAAIDGGATDVAESYVQEARSKFAALPPACKHFIGHVQTNKAKAIVETFDVVQSIDRLDAGRAIAKAARALGKPVRALVQVNISATERFGIDPADAPALAARLRNDEGLPIDGVMAIGPNTDDREEIARAFARAAEAFRSVGGETLSIGMSGDWEQAIRSGSTMLRIGTALLSTRMMHDDDDAELHEQRGARVSVSHKIGSFFSLHEDDELEDAVDHDDAAAPAPKRNVVAFSAREKRGGAAAGEVSLFAPRNFGDVTVIADALRSRQVVIVNLQGVDRSLLQRVVDFTSGVAYTLDGKIQKLADAMYLVVPPGTAVNSDGIKESLAADPSFDFMTQRG